MCTMKRGNVRFDEKRMQVTVMASNSLMAPVPYYSIAKMERLLWDSMKQRLMVKGEARFYG